MEPEGSSPYSQKPATCPYPESIWELMIGSYEPEGNREIRNVTSILLWPIDPWTPDQ
jgi:hypothetical protein